jgi:uncharacterized membrane protein
MPKRRLNHSIAACFGIALTSLSFSEPIVAQTSDDEIRNRVIPADPTLVGQTTQWQVCNQTSYVLRTASAFMRGASMKAKGWEEILPGSCITHTTPISGPRFLFAESIDAHKGGIREWKGTTGLCVDHDADFTSDAIEDCRLTNRFERDYFAVRPGEPVTTLVEPAEYGRERAVVAGQQRLLQDLGYEISSIDGIAGRRTSSLLRRFRSDNDLPSSLSGERLLQAMISVARREAEGSGLELCNGSDVSIWTAIATREDGRWRSRGWWRARPEECVQPLNMPLPGTDAHFFALQDDGEGGDLWMRSVSTRPAQFCIAESKFDAIGNEMCADQGYSVANFRPVSTDENYARIRLTNADFSEVTPGGLRR